MFVSLPRGGPPAVASRVPNVPVGATQRSAVPRARGRDGKAPRPAAPGPAAATERGRAAGRLRKRRQSPVMGWGKCPRGRGKRPAQRAGFSGRPPAARKRASARRRARAAGGSRGRGSRERGGGGGPRSGPHSPRPSARPRSPVIDRAASFPPTVALRRGAPRRSPLRARPAVRRRPPRGSLAARWTPASRTRGGPAPRPFARRQGEARGGGGASRRRRAVSVQRTVCLRTTVVRLSSSAPREVERTPAPPPYCPLARAGLRPSGGSSGAPREVERTHTHTGCRACPAGGGRRSVGRVRGRVGGDPRPHGGLATRRACSAARSAHQRRAS